MMAEKLILFCYYLIAINVLIDADANTNEADLHQTLNGYFSNDAKINASVSSLLAKNMLQLAQEIGKMTLNNSNRSTEVISPLNIYMALSTLLLGSSGPTYFELLHLLKIMGKEFCNLLGDLKINKFCEWCWFLRW